MSRSCSLLILSGLLSLAGCGDLSGSSKPQSSDRGIIGKTTQDVAEFNAEAGREISDGKMGEIDPALGPLAPLKAYGPALEKITMLAVQQNLNTFYAEYERYPKDHAEFMEKIIKANNMELPVLPAKHTYQYDVENHRLVIVKPEAEEPASESAAPGY